MLNFCLGVLAILAGFWKSLGRLFPKKWLSKRPSVGFARIFSLKGTDLEEKALATLTAALQVNLPLRAAGVHVEYLAVSVGLIAGFRVQASKVKVVLEQLSEESDWAGAEEAICSAQKGKGATEAKQSISLVEKAKKPRKPLGGAAARFLEVFACGVRLDVDELLVVIKGPEGQEDVEVAFGLHCKTSRSWAIEWRGAHAHLAASCRIRAGGQELLAPASVEVSADLPRVLQTMMVPSILPNKRAVAQVSLADIKLQLQPASVAALARISDTVNQFKGWKDAVVAEERSQVVPLGFGERALYMAALTGGKKDVSEWEQRMTCREILQARCEAQQWPVPVAMQLEEWLADLADRQKPLRALKMEMSLRSFTVEVLREGESPGSGCSARLEDMRFSGQFTAMDPRKPEDNNNSSKNEPDACPSGGQPKLRAQLCIRSLQIQCEPANTFAAPVLMPFALSGECSHDALEQKDSLSVRLRVSEVPQVPLNTLNTAVSTSDSTDEDADSPAPVAIKATVSSRSVWRLQSAARGLKDAAAAAQLASSRVPTRVPSASTLTAQEQKTKHVEEIRAAAHTEEIKLLFESLDTDHSGLLEFAELRELLESMYHVYMTPEEMGMATTQLFHRLKDASDGVSFQALSQFFIELSKGPGALENLCLELHEFNRPVPSNFVAEKAFAALLATDKASHPAQQGLAAEVLQLRWVRTLQNYQVAKETWLQDLAPTLEPRLRRWQLHDGMQAIDFWCDPMFSLRKQAMADQKQKKALTVNFDFKLDGLSVRLADTQHASSVPRAKLDMMGLELKGGVHRAADSSGFAPLERGLEGGGGLAGEVMFSAEYWNQSQRIVEPFVEPWKLELAGDENCLSIKAEQHAVLNITPPILQALTVFANSLKMQDAQLALSKLHQLEAKPVAAWVFNRTLCDVKVRAKGPSGMGDAVEISRWDFAEPFAIELKSTTSLERSKTFGGDSSGAHDSLLAGGGEERWYLEIEVRGGDGEDKSVGEGWWVRELVPFATTGRRLLRVGQHHLCVDFTVDVHTLAPVVSLSGISVLQNMTSRALTVNLGANRPDGQPRTVLVEPYQSWNGGISGGYEVSLPLEGGLPSDRRHLTLPLPLDSSDLGDGERVLQSQAGYRFVLLAHAGKLGKGEVRDRNVVCVPLLSVLNALPCEVVCSIRSQLPRRRRRQLLVHMDSEDPHDAGIEPFQPHPEPEPPLEVQPEPHTQKLSSGQKLGFNDVDPELPVEVAISFAGFAYNGVIPANSLRSRRAVAQSLRSGRFQLVSDDAAAPLLDVELDWEVQGAVMAVFSRYWVSDKTGWSLEASSGADMLHNAADAAMLKTQETARAVPIPPQGTWSCDASDSAVDATLGEIQTPSESAPPPIAGLPRLALMRVASEYLQVRLMQGRHGQSLKGWAWADGCEGPLQTWWGGHSRATDSGSNSHAQQSSEDAAEQTGWSSALSVGIVGSTGVAQLPSPSILGLGSLPAADVGLSVAGLPAPFERTKLVTVAPRYVVRNNLEQPLDIWPIRGNSRKAPFPSDHLLGNWKSEESSDAAAGTMRISTFAITSTPDGQLFFCGFLPDGHTVFGDLSAETPEGFFQAELHGYVRQGAVGEVRLRLDRSMDCLVTNCRPFDLEGENGTEQAQTEEASWQPDILAYSEDAPSICMVSPSASLSIGAIPQTSGYLSAATSSETVPMISVRMSASGKGDPNSGPTAWSVRLPLSTVGDTVFALAAPGGGGVPRVVRASVQLEGSTLFIVLSKGQWPYVIENRSVIHTVAFHQEGLSPAAAGCEWVLRPCEARRFVFPDPDKPKILLGRIVGAGESHVARYQLEDVSTGGQQPSLTIPGHDKAALGARVKAIGASCCLLLSDPEAVRQDASTEQAASVNDVIDGKDQASVISKLGLDVFLAGFHVCLVDTLRATPQELLGFTVDYVQLEKPRNKRSIALTVHHAQLDDFGDENSFVFGPLESGLNSRTSAVADKEGFTARPMLSCCLEGPFDWSIKLYDTDHRAITLKSLTMGLRPLELRLDVPRLLLVAARLKGWTSSIGQIGKASDATSVLLRVLVPGFRAPKGGDWTCSVGNLETSDVALNLDLKMTKRRDDLQKEADGSDEEQADLPTQLRKAFSGLGFFRPIMEFVARLGTSFADASPKFRFSPLMIRHASAVLAVLQLSVTRHFSQQLLQQSARVLGSLQVLGDPANLLEGVGSGVLTFLSKTKEEVMGERGTLGSGVNDLAEGVLGGALGSVAKISGSLKDTVGSSLGHPMGSDSKASSITEGVDLGYAAIAVGITEAVAGMVKEPFKQAHQDGLYGLATGTAVGAAGVVVRPLEGLLGAVEKLAQGAEGQIKGKNRGHSGLRRPPRVAFHKDVPGLQPLEQGFFWPCWLLKVESVSLPSLWKRRECHFIAAGFRKTTDSVANEVYITRSRGADQWCAQGGMDMAVGRVGQLRGPFELLIEALLESNLELSVPLRMLVGIAELQTSELETALLSTEPSFLTCKVMDVSGSGAQLGEVEVSLRPALDPKIMPERFIPKLPENSASSLLERQEHRRQALQTLGPATAAPRSAALEDIELTEAVLAVGRSV